MGLAYLPGFDHDVFVSYCHGDDRTWIRGFYELLKPALREQLGIEANIWIDEQALENSSDFRAEIPNRLSRSGLILVLASNQYVRSSYCVETECMVFESSIAERRSKYPSAEFETALFAFRIELLPVDNDDHHHLIAGLTDYKFHDGSFRLPLSSPAFQAEFGRLVVDISKLMKRMRNHSTKVFLYPRDPGPGVAEAHATLKSELVAHGYSVLPDSLVQIEQRALESELGIFLLDGAKDARLRPLVETFAGRSQRPWVVWESPYAHASCDKYVQMFVAHVVNRLDSPRRRYFNSSVSPATLKAEILELLKPAARVIRSPGPKRRVALICDPYQREELACAYDIDSHWNTEFEFDLPGDAVAAAAAGSDGVLLIWGNAKEAWASDQFERLTGAATPKGLCVFDPEKRAVVQQIRGGAGTEWHISEHYGRFMPALLNPFFTQLRQGQSVGDGRQ
jgi:hypothetical protein